MFFLILIFWDARTKYLQNLQSKFYNNLGFKYLVRGHEVCSNTVHFFFLSELIELPSPPLFLENFRRREAPPKIFLTKP